MHFSKHVLSGSMIEVVQRKMSLTHIVFFQQKASLTAVISGSLDHGWHLPWKGALHYSGWAVRRIVHLPVETMRIVDTLPKALED